MDALDLLEQQHRDVSALVERIATATSPGLRTSLTAELVRAIDAHSRVEEQSFYRAFSAKIGGDEGRLYESFEHHALLRFAAQNLLRTRATDVRFLARLRLVEQIFARHAAAEEDWMFPRAKRSFSDEELDVIGVELERAHAVRMDLDLARVPARAPAAKEPRNARNARPVRPTRASTARPASPRADARR